MSIVIVDLNYSRNDARKLLDSSVIKDDDYFQILSHLVSIVDSGNQSESAIFDYVDTLKDEYNSRFILGTGEYISQLVYSVAIDIMLSIRRYGMRNNGNKQLKLKRIIRDYTLIIDT